MFSGFQSNAYQSNAYQILSSSTPVAQVSGFGWKNPYLEYKQAEAQRQKIARERTRLAELDRKTAEIEAQQLALRDQANKRKAKAKAALEAKLQAEISRLRNERIWLIQRIAEEEAILVIFMMMRRKRRRAV